MNASLTKEEERVARRKLKSQLWKDYNKRCYLCNELLAIHESTIDHMDPLSRSGEDVPENRACACVDCNEEKSDLNVEEYKAMVALMQELEQNNILYNIRDKGFHLDNGDTYVPEIIIPAYNLIVDIRSGFDISFAGIVNEFRRKFPRWHVAVLKRGMNPTDFIHKLVSGGFRNANLHLYS